MSLPAMLVGETMEEILQASRFAREIVAAVSKTKDGRKPSTEPRTPLTLSAKKKTRPQNTDIRTRRMKEKQGITKSTRLESASPLVKKARSRISLKLSPASKTRCLSKNQNMIAQRVPPQSRPWGKRTVLFPNPVFHSSSPRHDQMPYEIRSPVTARRRKTPHKFVIKSPHSSSKCKVKVKITPATSLSPNRPVVNNSKLQSKNVTLASRLRRSFSPSQLASRFVSPLKSRVSSAQKANVLKRGLKQRFVCSPMRSFRKI